MSVIYSTVCEVLGGRAKTADDREFLDSAADVPAVIPLQRYYRRCITVTVVVPYTRWVPSPRYYREILPIPTVITDTAFPITVSFSSRYTDACIHRAIFPALLRRFLHHTVRCHILPKGFAFYVEDE